MTTKIFDILINWENPNSNSHNGGIFYEFIWGGTNQIIVHYQSNLGLLTLLAEILELRASSTGVNIQVFQTGKGKILKLEQYNF